VRCVFFRSWRTFSKNFAPQRGLRGLVLCWRGRELFRSEPDELAPLAAAPVGDDDRIGLVAHDGLLALVQIVDLDRRHRSERDVDRPSRLVLDLHKRSEDEVRVDHPDPSRDAVLVDEADEHVSVLEVLLELPGNVRGDQGHGAPPPLLAGDLTLAPEHKGWGLRRASRNVLEAETKASKEKRKIWRNFASLPENPGGGAQKNEL